METKSFNRRSFLKYVAGAAAVLPALATSVKAQAAGSCPANPPAGKQAAKEGEGMAKGLEYVADATKSKNEKYKAPASCGSCKYFNAAKAEGGYAPCTMMGMKYVSNCGWCKSYLKKA